MDHEHQALQPDVVVLVEEVALGSAPGGVLPGILDQVPVALSGFQVADAVDGVVVRRRAVREQAFPAGPVDVGRGEGERRGQGHGGTPPAAAARNSRERDEVLGGCEGAPLHDERFGRAAEVPVEDGPDAGQGPGLVPFALRGQAGEVFAEFPEERAVVVDRLPVQEPRVVGGPEEAEEQQRRPNHVLDIRSVQY